MRKGNNLTFIDIEAAPIFTYTTPVIKNINAILKIHAVI